MGKEKSGCYHKCLFEDKVHNEIMNLKYDINELYKIDIDYEDIVNKLCFYSLQYLNRKSLLESIKEDLFKLKQRGSDDETI